MKHDKDLDTMAKELFYTLVVVAIFTIIGIVLKAIYLPEFAKSLFGG